MKKRIAIIGSTGSIGKQALDVISLHNNHFEVEVLAANNNAELLIRQAIKHKPNVVVIGNDIHYKKVFDRLDPLDIKVYAGTTAMSQITEMESIDLVLVAVVGFAGLEPTIAAIGNRKTVAIANKESLVAAGKIIQQKALENRVQVIPVDSEHSAIFQCLMGEGNNPVDKIILTASGGPFRGMNMQQLKAVKPDDALKHPVWKMGKKVSIDSATLMNKGLEAIEAHWLFGVNASRIEVVIHPESIIHSMVCFADGSIKTQMSYPDMRLPVQFAFSYPERLPNLTKPVDFVELGSLNFTLPDVKNFRNLALAFEALEKGGNAPCVLNASNEIAVQAFLQEQIRFLQIPELVEKSLHGISFVKDPSLDDIIETDQVTRLKAHEYIRLLD